MKYAEITGWGKYLPPAILSNADLTTFMDTSDEWITERSGIKERRWLKRDDSGFTTMTGAEMGAEAARMADA